MTRVDQLGFVILELRSAAAVTALVPALSINGGEQRKASPSIVVSYLDSRPSATAPRTPSRTLLISFKCIVAKAATADILCVQIANAVAEFLHYRGPRVSSSGVAIWLSTEQNTGAVQRDPVTDDPFVVVIASLKAAASAVA